MKWTSLGVIVLATAVAIGCERNTSDEDLDNRDEIGTSGAADDGSTRADADDQRTTSGLGRTAVAAREFVHDVSIVNHAEVEMAQLALERAGDQEVKQFAQMMIRDHTKAGNELKQAVSRHNVELTMQMDAKHQSLVEKLKELRGPEFDREYMSAMVEGHRDARDLIDSRAGDARATGTAGTAGSQAENHDEALDNAVKQWATQTLPAVERHLKRAEEIRDRIAGAR
jgi:putative membrane protein